MSKVYLFLADGFEETEAITPTDLLRRAGIDVCLVSLNDSAVVTGSHNIRLTADAVFEQCSWDDASMFVLPGGKVGTENLEKHKPLTDLLQSAGNQGIILAAICAAPRVLGRLGLLEGKKACCYPGEEPSLDGALVTHEPVTVANGVITSRGMGTAFDFGLALVRHLCGEEAAEAVARKTVYKAVTHSY